jgi:hypothetical protein
VLLQVEHTGFPVQRDILNAPLYHDLSPSLLPLIILFHFYTRLFLLPQLAAPMSSSQNPTRSNDAPEDGAPPPQQQPPQYSEQPTIELPRDESPANTQQERQDLPPRTRTKSETSSYIGSYRPTDAQTPNASVHSSNACKPSSRADSR